MISFETLRGNPVGKIAEKAVYIECIFDNKALYFECRINIHTLLQTVFLPIFPNGKLREKKRNPQNFRILYYYNYCEKVNQILFLVVVVGWNNTFTTFF